MEALGCIGPGIANPYRKLPSHFPSEYVCERQLQQLSWVYMQMSRICPCHLLEPCKWKDTNAVVSLVFVRFGTIVALASTREGKHPHGKGISLWAHCMAATNAQSTLLSLNAI